MLFGGTAVLRRILAFSVTIALLCVIPAAAIAGVISETVTAPSGTVMPNVMVVAVNEETGLRSTVISDGKGFYGFPCPRCRYLYGHNNGGRIQDVPRGQADLWLAFVQH